MVYNLITSLEYCGAYVNGILDLLLYSHIPVVAIVLFVAFFIYIKNRKLLPSQILLVLSIIFTCWAALNVTIWLNYANASVLMFAWSLIEVFSVLLFIFCFYFVYTFIQERDLLTWQKILMFVPILPILILAPTDFYLTIYDMQECVGVENGSYIEYVRWIKIVFAVLTLSYLSVSFIKKGREGKRKQVAILAFGIIAFLYSFMIAGYIAEQTLNYTYEFYGLFPIIVFIGSLAYLIVRYAAFDIKLIGGQALVVTLVLLTGARLFFSTNTTGLVIGAITFLLTGIFGYFLVRSIKREVALRADLQLANTRQQETMRFITHEVKGYLTDGAAALDALGTGSFGPVTPDMKSMVGEALTKNRAAVREIQNFLRIADFKTGKIAYAMKSFDFKNALDEVLVELKKKAETKGLSLAVSTMPENYTMVGDSDQILKHVIENLVANAINYTPKGEIGVHLERTGTAIRFSVKDSGVGLTNDDKRVLFTEGGHGKESRVTNPHSTGYGLFIAKQIVDAHHGHIWAESAGRGAGSTFFVELPTDLRPTSTSTSLPRMTA